MRISVSSWQTTTADVDQTISVIRQAFSAAQAQG
jgi:hypothetical protein